MILCESFTHARSHERACVFSFILIPEKLVNYLLIRGTMGILLRIYVISILLKYTDVQCHVQCHS